MKKIDWNKIIDSELDSLARFLATLEWSNKFMQTKEYQEVKKLYEAGDAMGAQKLILAELEKANQEAGEHGN